MADVITLPTQEKAFQDNETNEKNLLKETKYQKIDEMVSLKIENGFIYLLNRETKQRLLTIVPFQETDEEPVEYYIVSTEIDPTFILPLDFDLNTSFDEIDKAVAYGKACLLKFLESFGWS